MADTSDNGGKKNVIVGVGEFLCRSKNAFYKTYLKEENDLIEKGICPKCKTKLNDEGKGFLICEGGAT